MSGQRSSSGHHRCVTLLYRIPMWIFDCVLGFAILFLYIISSYKFCIAFCIVSNILCDAKNKTSYAMPSSNTPVKVAQWYVVHECDATMTPWKSTVRTTIVFIFSCENNNETSGLTHPVYACFCIPLGGALF